MPNGVEIRLLALQDRSFEGDEQVLCLSASSGGSRRPVHVHLSYEAFVCLGPEEANMLAPMMLRFALSGIESGFRGGMYACESPGAIDIFISAEEVDALRIAEADLMCHWMVVGKSGPECSATDAKSKSMTTLSACHACEVADDRLRCSDFVHPTTLVASEMTFTRELASSYCNSGDGRSGRSCNPMRKQRPCWKRRVLVGEISGEPPQDIGERVVDEIDFFTVAYWLSTGQKKPWPIPQARSVSAFFGPCIAYKDFLLRAATVADLLDKLEVAKTWGEADDRNLTRLVAFIAQTHPGLIDDAERLRGIHSLRNLHPIHSQRKETAAFARLGLRYPPDSWDVAWRQVLALLHQSLRNLRRAMQSSVD